MRVGIFGGTFNPVHFGHIRAATEVARIFALDRCYLVPSALPPHKDPTGIATPQDRMAMLCVAIEGLPVLQVSDVELRRSGPSYTIDTVRHFIQQWNAAPDIFLIMGVDAFMEIETWKSSRDLFALVPMVVVSRPGDGYRTRKDMARAVHQKLQAHLSKEYRYDSSEFCFQHNGYQTVYLADIDALDISSTHVRERLSRGASTAEFVPDVVFRYIRKKGLYQ